MIINQCKRCRRFHQKLFLKGERCFSSKCALLRKSYPPGLKSKRYNRAPSEYGRQLREKQKLRNLYGISGRQLKTYFQKAILKKGQSDPAKTLLEFLEGRLDSTVFNLGWASSRRAARQMVSHKKISVNGRLVDVPSQQIKVGDVIIIKEPKEVLAKTISQRLKTHQPPSWLVLDKSNLAAKVLKRPLVDELEIAVETPLIIEYFSH